MACMWPIYAAARPPVISRARVTSTGPLWTQHAAAKKLSKEFAGTSSHQGKGVQNEVLLDLEVQRTICAKAGGVVHFQQPGAALVVQQDIVPQQLKAGKAIVIWRPDSPAGTPHRLTGFG